MDPQGPQVVKELRLCTTTESTPARTGGETADTGLLDYSNFKHSWAVGWDPTFSKEGEGLGALGLVQWEGGLIPSTTNTPVFLYTCKRFYMIGYRQWWVRVTWELGLS